jgi:hypothetical protein
VERGLVKISMLRAQGQNEPVHTSTCQIPSSSSRAIINPYSGWVGAYMTPENLNRYNSKWPEKKLFFNPYLFLSKDIRIIFC